MNTKKIGERLAKLRGNKSQAKVAQDIGIAPTTLSMYENGERTPRDNIKLRIANYYGVTVESIFFTK